MRNLRYGLMALVVVGWTWHAFPLGGAQAESFAAGANALRGFVNYGYLRNADHGWPTKDRKWRHSDIKNVDYRYVQDFFRHIKEATE